MAVGRISGPLLKANLERNGVDLDFRNQPSDTPLLFFDVSTSRLGIKKDAPATDLDIIGASMRTSDLQVSANNTQIANYTLNGCLLYTSPSPRDLSTSRMPSSA